MNFHPLFVHFPVVLFSIAFIFEIIEAFLKRYFNNSSFFFLSLAILFSLIAVQTGNIDAQSLNLKGEVKYILERHQSGANFSIFLFALTFMLKLYISFRQKNPSLILSLALLALYLVGLLFIYRTTYLGMKLVFDYGVGVKLN